MKILKRIPLLVFAILMATMAFAQKGEMKMKNNKADLMLSELDLTEEQQTKVEALKADFKEKLTLLKGNEELSPEAKKESFKSLRQERKEAMASILTEEQKVKLESIKSEKRAEMKEKKKEKREKHKAQKAELKQLRTEFDSQISAEDKATLTSLRTVFKEKRMLEKGISKEEKPNREEMKAHREAFKAEHEEEIAQMKILAEKYKDEIDVFLKNKGFEPALRKEKGSKVGEKGELKRKGKRKHHKSGKGRKISAFLLMEVDQENTNNISVKDSKVTIFPNPASDYASINYEVRTEGNVRVLIQDENGNLIRTLVDETAEAGEYSIEVNTSNLGNKNYFVIVKDAQGITSKQLVKVK